MLSFQVQLHSLLECARQHNIMMYYLLDLKRMLQRDAAGISRLQPILVYTSSEFLGGKLIYPWLCWDFTTFNKIIIIFY